MANTIQTLDWFSKESLRLLYVNCVAAQLVHRGYDSEFRGKKGDTIRILRPVEFTAQEFDETAGVTVQDITESYVSLSADYHFDISFEYGSAEKALKMPDFKERYIDPALKEMAEAIDRTVINKAYKGFYSYYGTPGTTPSTKASILQARKNLQDQLVPLKDRKFIMDSAAEAEYLELFSDADKDGSTAALREASLGRRFGLDTYMDQHIGLASGALHTPGNPTPGAGNTLQLNADIAAGATSLVLKESSGVGTLTGSVKEGDLFEIAGISGSFVCTADAAAASNLISVSFWPATTAAVTAGTNVTWLGVTDAGVTTDYVNNLMFNKGAIALAFARLEEPQGAAFAKTYTYKGFAIRMVLAYNATYKKEMLSLDVLFGTKCIDPRLGTRLLG